MFRLFLSVILLLFVSACDNQPLKNKYTTTKSGQEVLFELVGGRNSEGAFLKLKKNKLAYIYTCFEREFQGGVADDATASICIITSENKENTIWSKPKVLIEKPEKVLNIMSVSAKRIDKDTILISYAEKIHKNKEIRLTYIISSDELKTLSSPKYFYTYYGYNVVNNDRIMLDGNELYVPISRHIPYIDNIFSYAGKIELYKAKLSNLSYGKIIELPIDTSSILQEPGVTKLNDDCLLVWVRNDLPKIKMSKSCDDGLSWSDWYQGSLNIVPFSPSSIKKYGDKHYIVYSKAINEKRNLNTDEFWRVEQKRNNLWLAVSDDDLQTIEYEVEIDKTDNGYFNYVAMYKEDDFLYLGYSGLESEKTIMKLVRVKLKDKL